MYSTDQLKAAIKDADSALAAAEGVGILYFYNESSEENQKEDSPFQILKKILSE